jgi:phosphohistidine swiveling domain-containing protein
MESNLNPKNYVLTFKASGVSVFVTDIHKDAYKKLEVLFIIEHGEFKQYFTKTAYNRALNLGLEFYKNKKRVTEYQKNIFLHNKKFTDFFSSKIKGSAYISKSVLKTFFEYTKTLCSEYTKMNIEFTEKAFTYKEKNKNIGKNLEITMKSKDVVRSFMNMVLFEKNSYLSILFKILSKQFAVNYKILENLTQKEIFALYKSELKNPGLILKRQNALVSIWNKNQPILGANAIKIIKNFKQSSSKTNRVEGQIANKGKVSGRVKIIPVNYGNMQKINKEIGKMKKGDVLIAETTAPELILACQKASAIITDLGGLMSHAAIISRELKIPCIVGTKSATKVFKDGDLVEVDANNGIVRKIK